MDPYVIGLFAFVVCVLVSRVLSERAFRALPADQKVTLMDGFSGMRAYSMIPVLGILAVMFGLPQLVPAHPRIGLFVGLGLLLVYVVGMHVVIVRRLRAMEINPKYQRDFMFARHVSHLGMFVLFGCLLYETVK